MPDVLFTVSTGFLQRMRDAIVREQSNLQGQSNTVLNEAARVRVRTLIKQWVVQSEENAAVATAAQTARAGISQPGDGDIT
jgi:D-alanyl-D-alanine carboxypeptidase